MKALNLTIISQSWEFFRVNFKDIAVMMIPIILVTTLASNLSIYFLDLENRVSPPKHEWLEIITYVLIKMNCIAIDVSIFLLFMKNIIYDSGYSKVQLLLALFYKLPYLLILTSIASLLILFASLFALIPGVWLSLRFSYAWMYLIFDDINPIKALILSFKETKAELSIIIKNLVILFFAALFVIIVSSILLSIFVSSFVTSFLITLIATLLFLLVQVVLYRIYSEYGNDRGEGKSL